MIRGLEHMAYEKLRQLDLFKLAKKRLWEGLILVFTWLMEAVENPEPDCSRQYTLITQEATCTGWNEGDPVCEFFFSCI